MKKITLIGTAESSPLIKQVENKELAIFRIAVTKYGNGKAGKPYMERTWHEVICKKKKLVSKARLYITKGTPVAVEVDIIYGKCVVTSMLTMKP